METLFYGRQIPKCPLPTKNFHPNSQVCEYDFANVIRGYHSVDFELVKWEMFLGAQSNHRNLLKSESSSLGSG